VSCVISYIAEMFNPRVGRTNVTDRQTTDRRNGFTMANTRT